MQVTNELMHWTPASEPIAAQDDERRAMQRRIKHQRRELKRLNTSNRALQMLVRTFSNKMAEERRHGYRHAAQMAESFRYWPFGKRIAAYIREWL